MTPENKKRIEEEAQKEIEAKDKEIVELKEALKTVRQFELDILINQIKKI